MRVIHLMAAETVLGLAEAATPMATGGPAYAAVAGSRKRIGVHVERLRR